MFKLRTFIIALCFTFIFNNIALADNMYRYEEQKDLTPEQVSILKYKMERITIRQEFGKWTITQGINTDLTDVQLLKLINSEHIASDRLRGVESKQNIGAAISIAGLALSVIGGIVLSNIIKIENNTYYGAGGIAAGVVLFGVGNVISPIVNDENEHVITVEEAKNAAQKYNTELKLKLHLNKDMD